MSGPDVKRYTLKWPHNSIPELVEDEAGLWVRWEDVAALLERVDAERARANKAEDDYESLRVELATERTTHAVRLDHMIWLDQRVKTLEAGRDAQRARAEKAEQLLGEKVVELEDAEDSAVEAHRAKNSAEARVRKLESQAAPLARLRELWASQADEDEVSSVAGAAFTEPGLTDEFAALLSALLSPAPEQRAEGDALEASLTAARERIAVLEEALRPFVLWAEYQTAPHASFTIPDPIGDGLAITKEEIDVARRALNPEETK